ncbi:MAG: tRNA (N(6)-L-threonylcarbamoyladenosine(37)-C(2))-methylthiotransferase MtaB [Candidatus Omnitrophota bacterium]
MKTFHLKTFGCKVNQCDSQDVRYRLLQSGYTETRDCGDADLRIVNTCCVTSQAERRSRQAVRIAGRLGPSVVLGCCASYAKDVLRGFRGVEQVFGPGQKKDFFRWIGGRVKRISTPQQAPRFFCGRTRAFLKIQDGCDNGCSYCVVPRMRGRALSVPFQRVLLRVCQFVCAGHKEVVLTGVNLGSFGRDVNPATDIVELITRIEAVEGIERIRLSSIEAWDITEHLLEKMRSSSKLCPHLHIPFQSGADEVLKAMNRRQGVSDYRRIVEAARKRVKDLMISCDIIAGFPTETEKDFRQTLSFLKWLKPLKTHVFPFSPRKGTKAASFSLLPSPLVKERSEILRQNAAFASEECRRGRIGRILDVLFESKRKDVWEGHSREYFLVKFPCGAAGNLRNVSAKVKALDSKEGAIIGELLNDRERS